MQKKRGEKAPSIRTTVTITTAVAILLMFVVLYAVYYLSMQKMLIERENDNMIGQVQLAENVLQSSVGHLPSITRDWSSWDFTYDFALGEYDEFLDDYLTEYPFQLFRLNFLTIIAADGSIAFEGFYDHRESEYMTNPPDLSDLYEKVGPLAVASFVEGEELDLTNTTQIGAPGFVQHGDQVYFLSAYPIIRSDETGPCAGVFIFGRIIDQEEIRFLTASSGMEFAIHPMESEVLSQSEKETLVAGGSLVRTEGDDVAAYKPVADIFGEAALVVSFESPRTLYAQGNNVIRLILAIIALCCLGLLLVVLNLLMRIVIRPLDTLVDEVNNIDMDTVDKPLLAAGKNRELDRLTAAANEMLHRIKTARDTIARNNEKIHYQAHFDSLTGLQNRFSATEALTREIALAEERAGAVSVFFFDLDRFKFINDTLGHSAGDRFMVSLAGRLRQSFGEATPIARMGGDEFVIIARDLKGEAQRQLFTQLIFDIFRDPFFVKHHSLLMGVSVGSSTFPEDGQDAEALIKNAEIALFRAKEMGRGLYLPYQEEMQTAVFKRSYIENKLRVAVMDGCEEFQAFFQPKVNVQTGKIVGCEALIRWVTFDGVIEPVEFIPQAEESGLILSLSWWMIRECCRLGSEFERQGVDCTISVNVSAQVLLHDDFLPVVKASILETGMDVRRLDIEIVEATLVADMEKVNDILRALHDMGAEISVDDFGTGYSSLSYLHRMAVDRIKIDRSFISRIGDSREDQAIVDAIIAMAKSLRMTVTAEGVEEKRQYDFLKKAQCQEVQGFLVSKAIPSDAFVSFYKNWDPQKIG